MKWDSKLYDERHGFVSEYGKSLADQVDNAPCRRIWDLGCGTGTLTHYLARRGATVIGTDQSPDMIGKARELYPELEFRIADALSSSFETPFDTVFSNAVFHWIHNHQVLLRNIAANLNSGGRLVCEMGASGNIKQIETAFRSAMERHGHSYEDRFFFPSGAEYEALLDAAGFDIEMIDDFDRPTPFEGGEEGMARWLEQFHAFELSPLSPERRKSVILEAETLLKPLLLHEGTWIGDYRRLRFIAVKRQSDT